MQKPTRTYSVIVPTKAYLRKFIYAEHGYPLELNYLTPLGTLILCMLENDYFSIKMNNHDKDTRIQYMNDKIQFMAPVSTMQYKGHSLSKDRIIAINRFIEAEFMRELSFYCKSNVKNRAWRPGIKDAIAEFCKKYSIKIDCDAAEEDISSDALIKAEYRYRKRKEKKDQTILERNVLPPNPSINSLLFPSFGTFAH